MADRMERILSLTLTVAAVLMAGTLIHREYATAKTQYADRIPQEPTYERNWQSMVSAGVTVGASNAPVRVLEFADFECPFCRRFEATWERLREHYGDNVSLVFIHYPLGQHRFARSAARAAECANAQRKFRAFDSLLFAKQDSFGLKSWVSFAQDAALPDSSAFASCIATDTLLPRVENGVALGNKIGIEGTPTVIVNGWRFYGVPSDTELSRTVDSLLVGKTPYKSARGSD